MSELLKDLKTVSSLDLQLQFVSERAHLYAEEMERYPNSSGNIKDFAELFRDGIRDLLKSIWPLLDAFGRLSPEDPRNSTSLQNRLRASLLRFNHIIQFHGNPKNKRLTRPEVSKKLKEELELLYNVRSELTAVKYSMRATYANDLYIILDECKGYISALRDVHASWCRATGQFNKLPSHIRETRRWLDEEKTDQFVMERYGEKRLADQHHKTAMLDIETRNLFWDKIKSTYEKIPLKASDLQSIAALIASFKEPWTYDTGLYDDATATVEAFLVKSGCPLKLSGEGKPILISGRAASELNGLDYDIIAKLSDRYPDSCSKKELEDGGFGDPHKRLQRIAKEKPLIGKHLQLPGGKGKGGYRII